MTATTRRGYIMSITVKTEVIIIIIYTIRCKERKG